MTERNNPIWIVRRILDRRLKRLVPRLQGVVLDIGSGPQPYRELLLRSGVKRYVALDWPNSPHGPGMEVAADMTKLPFAGRVFDGVLCTQVLEHCAEPGLALAEAARVLKKNGRLLLSVPFLFPEHELPWDYFRYTDQGIRYLLEKSGLAVGEIRQIGGPGVVVAVLVSRAAGIVLGWGGDVLVALLGRVFKFRRREGVSWPGVLAGYLDLVFAALIQLPVYCCCLLLERISRLEGASRILRPVTTMLEKQGTEINAGYVIMAEKKSGGGMPGGGV